jgi:hypothetical protein
MKIHRILCLGIAIALPELAFAEIPFDIQTLAQIDGVIDYCSQLKPETADVYKQLGKLMEKSVPEKDLEAARNSKDYKEARKSVSEGISKVNKEEAAKSCSDFLKADK